MSKTVLITGGGGFVGAHLSSYLCNRGYKVIILDNFLERAKANIEFLDIEVELLIQDVADPYGLDLLMDRSIDIIFHLAGNANVPKSVLDPQTDFNANTLGTFNVLEFARRKQISKLIFPSSVSVYEPNGLMPIQENSPIRASSPYGASKIAAENYCFAYGQCYKLNITVLRLFNVFGPLMTKHVIHDLVRKLQRDPHHLVIMGDGYQQREYLYVDDAVKGFVLAADCGLPGEVYNLGTGIPVRIRDLAEEIIKVMDLNGVDIEYTMESWPGDINAWYADISKIRKLGFSPEISWEEGLIRTVSFFKQHPNEII